MPKFKIGDRVRPIKDGEDCDGSAPALDRDASYEVMDCKKNSTRLDVGWHYHTDRLELVAEEPVTFRPGDCVRRFRSLGRFFDEELREGLYIVDELRGRPNKLYLVGHVGSWTREHFELVARGPEPEPKWKLGEFKNTAFGSQPIHTEKHLEKIQVNGDDCVELAQKIVDFLNEEEQTDGSV